MAKGHKPVAGSRAFWPRKRAKRIYPAVGSVPAVGDKTTPLAFACYKAGMIQVSYIDNRKGSPTHGQEKMVAATVLDSPPLVVCGMRLYKDTPYGSRVEATVMAESLSKDLGRKARLPSKPHAKEALVGKDISHLKEVRILVHTKPMDSGSVKRKPEMFEIPLSGETEKQFAYALEKLGKEITPEDVFAAGELVDAKAVTKGKGVEGPVARFGVRIRGRKHGMKRRHIGNLAPRTPARVLPGAVAQAGQHGFQTRTEYNKRLLRIGADGFEPKGGFPNYGKVPKGYLLIEGSVPGPKKRLVILRKAMRPTVSRPEPVELKHVALESQQ